MASPSKRVLNATHPAKNKVNFCVIFVMSVLFFLYFSVFRQPIKRKVLIELNEKKIRDAVVASIFSTPGRLSRYTLFSSVTKGKRYQNNAEPSVSCFREERIGTSGEGGKWMCDVEALRDKVDDCLIYSIGSNNDFSWESAVKARAPNCEIHVFDHTVINATNKPKNVFFHKWGLTHHKSKKSDHATNPNLKSLAEISNLLGHNNKTLDVFKIDCEGCEWDTHQMWFASGFHKIEEILVELHHGTNKPSPNSRAKQFFTHLHESGYRIFHKEPNVHYSGGSGLCVEFAFRRIDSEQLLLLDKLKR